MKRASIAEMVHEIRVRIRAIQKSWADLPDLKDYGNDLAKQLEEAIATNEYETIRHAVHRARENCHGDSILNMPPDSEFQRANC